MELSSQFVTLAIALGLGLLVGLQRERSTHRLGGFRTFPIVTVLGCITAMLAQSFGGWIVAAGLVAITGVIVIGSIASRREESSGSGVTTEAAMLLMFSVGAFLVVGPREIAIAIGAGAAVLLQFKDRLHGLASRISDDDIRAIMQFALLALVILPALPNRGYGPYGVFNPHSIWLMVVLIVGINLAGYVAFKLFGESAGTALSGLLGGLISSTATTVTYARRAAAEASVSGIACIVIVIASTVVFARLLLELAITAPAHIRTCGPPLAALLGVFAVLAIVAWMLARRGKSEPVPLESSTELKSAFMFGLLYAAVLFAVAFAKDRFGDAGLYVVATVSGLTDVDAITLSSGQLMTAGALDPNQGWRVVMVAALSNIAFKTAVVATLGPRQLFGRIAVLFAVGVLAGIAMLLLWPAV